jgi:hypothetical protein
VRDPERLSPSVLFRAAEALDELATDLGFDADTPDYTPETEVTQDDIEEVREKMAEWVATHAETGDPA